ncbi:O-antigen ligase [Clostridium sp. DJ247]|uniref:O-antigen ligase family protein n=1 Tax=Clostridium sp. DJ247 TaxID=2726188 RepID=UPI001628EC0E|nr:O-antigen ligase family protein [Clostridium sp. DJ247]MBC2580562.1 hypothetical protein [Clostridium sp. DJ247]
MNIKASIVLVIITIIMFILNNSNYLKNKKYINVIILLFSTCLAISVKIDYNQYIIGKNEYVHIPLALFLIGIIAIFTINHNTKKIGLDNILMIIFLITIFISYGSNQIYDVVSFWTIVSTYLSIFFIGFIFKNIQEYEYYNITNFFSYIAIFNGILGIAQFITNRKLLFGQFNDNIYYLQGSELVKRVVGIAGTNNAGGNLGCILFAVVFFNYLKRKNTVNLTALILTSIFSILTLTRIGYLGIIIVLFVNFIMSKWNSMSNIVKKMLIIAMCAIIVVIIIVTFGDKINYILFEQRGNTQDSRKIQFDFIFNNIMKYVGFFGGIGAGQYKYYAYYFIGYNDIDIHSEYLNIMVENGVLMFILFIVLNIYLLVHAFKKCDDKIEQAFIVGLFLANLVCSNFNPNQYYIINNLLYYLLIYCFVYKKKSNLKYKLNLSMESSL